MSWAWGFSGHGVWEFVKNRQVVLMACVHYTLTDKYLYEKNDPERGKEACGSAPAQQPRGASASISP